MPCFPRFPPSPQTQLPQQKLQLQEACMRKEKSVALLEHQLVEVEVRGQHGGAWELSWEFWMLVF